MKLTLENLERERKRAIVEHTPPRILRCRICEEIKPIEDFSQSGRKRRECKECRHIAFEHAKAEGWLVRSPATKAYRRLKKRDRATTLTSQEFKKWYEREVAEGVCFYCEHPIEPGGRHGLGSFTIDRMDNTVGYKVGNMVACCLRCNIIKGSWFSFEEMLELGQKYLKGKPY